MHVIQLSVMCKNKNLNSTSGMTGGKGDDFSGNSLGYFFLVGRPEKFHKNHVYIVDDLFVTM